MKRYEIVGNAIESETLCYVLGERLTLGAAKKFADQKMLEDLQQPEPSFASIEVDDGRNGVLYSVTPATLCSTSLRNEVRHRLMPA